MWYYESLANQWPCNAWADDSHRFAAVRVIWYNYCVVPLCEGKVESTNLLAHFIARIEVPCDHACATGQCARRARLGEQKKHSLVVSSAACSVPSCQALFCFVRHPSYLCRDNPLLRRQCLRSSGGRSARTASSSPSSFRCCMCLLLLSARGQTSAFRLCAAHDAV